MKNGVASSEKIHWQQPQLKLMKKQKLQVNVIGKY